MSDPVEHRGARPRAPRRGSTPTVSIIIVSKGDAEALESCMSRLGSACHRFGAEIVVVVPGSDGDIATLRKQYPTVRVLAAPADLAHHDLRGVGLLEATGDIVAFTDESESRGEEWLAVLERRAHTSGAYGPAPNGSIDWVRYLEERGLLFRNGDGA